MQCYFNKKNFNYGLPINIIKRFSQINIQKIIFLIDQISHHSLLQSHILLFMYNTIFQTTLCFILFYLYHLTIKQDLVIITQNEMDFKANSIIYSIQFNHIDESSLQIHYINFINQMSDKLIIKKRRGQNILPDGLEIQLNLNDSSLTVHDLKKLIQKQSTFSYQNVARIEPLRQWLTYDDLKTVLDDNKKPINILNLKSGQILVVKDLGPQLQWVVVFYSEYIGPIIMFTLLYFLGKRENYNFTQKSALWMIIGHYLKRILETRFVHIFSRDSMPTRRALINCFHYWILCGLAIGSELYLFRSFEQTPLWKFVPLATFVVFEFLNLMCHITLSNLRKKPQQSQGEYVALNKQRAIPFGYGFDLVSSANYFWEVLSWASFSIFTGSYACKYFYKTKIQIAIGFTIFSFGQMLIWAQDKHRRYKQEFGDKYPKQRKAMVPFII
ncbi:hypothetical protein pb186bvf_011524 [Paramecium bursaria]